MIVHDCSQDSYTYTILGRATSMRIIILAKNRLNIQHMCPMHREEAHFILYSILIEYKYGIQYKLRLLPLSQYYPNIGPLREINVYICHIMWNKSLHEYCRIGPMLIKRCIIKHATLAQRSAYRWQQYWAN